MNVDAIKKLGDEALDALEPIGTQEDLEEWRIKHLGRKSWLAKATSELSSLVHPERGIVGREVNRTKFFLEEGLKRRSEKLWDIALRLSIETEKVDVTLPARPHRRGGLHPVTRLLREVLDVFRSMGFSIVEGPEVELDYYNFEALRIPADHPARDMWDTMWVDHEIDGRRPMLLRTHTSPAQIRLMEQYAPPIRVAVPGRAYRFEATDTTHEWMMTQIEILAVDEGITLAHLKGTLLELMRRLFGRDRQVRLQCSYFPFVEPGAEVAMDCYVCSGNGCATCHQSGWIEMGGAGMVHPEILENMGFDSKKYTGFAAGMGLERLAMNYFGVPDIRYFYQNDLRLLQQF